MAMSRSARALMLRYCLTVESTAAEYDEVRMRDQYVGDISDYIKYALLRALAEYRHPLGIAWYYNAEHDGRPDGRRREYLQQESWRALDEDLYDKLWRLPDKASLRDIQDESRRILPRNTVFHDEQMPAGAGRHSWAERMYRELSACELVFLDPDNGVGKRSKRRATFDEVRMLRRPGRTLVVIKFPQFNVRHDVLVADYHKHLKAETHAQRVATLRTSIVVRTRHGHLVPRYRWFAALDFDDRQAAQIFSSAAGWIPSPAPRRSSLAIWVSVAPQWHRPTIWRATTGWRGSSFAASGPARTSSRPVPRVRRLPIHPVSQCG